MTNDRRNIKCYVVRDPQFCGGFSLLELIVTLTVLSILVMGTIPLAQNAAVRQRELRLRETLREVRNAIDEFKRDTLGACPQGAIVSGNPIAPPQMGGNIPTDPRSRVVIDDCTIFDTENLDRYPPDLETLVNGVRVIPRGVNMTAGSGLGDDKQATEINDADQLTKVYLREMPVDPMTGESDWKLRSSYQAHDSESWDDINVFDIRSSSEEEALNGEKYSDW
ncbi:MAG: type II secretion system protein [Pyrinomonadaceae bacterium]